MAFDGFTRVDDAVKKYKSVFAQEPPPTKPASPPQN